MIHDASFIEQNEHNAYVKLMTSFNPVIMGTFSVFADFKNDEQKKFHSKTSYRLDKSLNSSLPFN